MDNIKWHTDKLLEESLEHSPTTEQLRVLSELVLDSVMQSMTLEIIGARSETTETSLNHDDERRSLL